MITFKDYPLLKLKEIIRFLGHESPYYRQDVIIYLTQKLQLSIEDVKAFYDLHDNIINVRLHI